MRNDGAFTVSSVSGAETITSPLLDSVDTVSRMAALDWQAIVNDLNESGNALLRKIGLTGVFRFLTQAERRTDLSHSF